jgi:hypothetical protein
MQQVLITEAWKAAYPGASIGVLASSPDKSQRVGRQSLFASYIPTGIDKGSVHERLQYIRDSVLLVSPEAQVLSLNVYR